MMRKTFLALFISFLIIGECTSQQSTWQWVNPLPQGNPLNGVWASNNNNAVLVGGYGTVMRTTNGGTTWQVQQAAGGFTGELFAVKFMTSQLGWAVGEGGQILKTEDGGSEWSVYSASTFQDFYALDFTSTLNGWVVGRGGTIFATTNGGITWQLKPSGTTVPLYSIFFTNDSTGWIAGGSGKILKTTNAGNTWIAETSGVSTGLFALHFISPLIGWATGANGIILKTFNGGTNWIPQFSGVGTNFYAIHFVNSTTGWAAGSYGSISKTTNGGSQWFQQSTNSYNDLYGMHMVSATEGWVVGDYGVILASTDGGADWENQSTGPKNLLFSASFPSTNTGYVVGEEGEILKTTNAGLSWLTQNSGLYLPLYDVDFINTSIGWAVGDSAVILRTTNGGVTWNSQNSHLEMTLYSVDFVNSSVGWAVGDEGTILKTINGGGTWTLQESNSFGSFQKVKFLNELLGWVVGYGGEILKTTDGGINWLAQNSNTGQTLYSAFFVNSNVGYASGDFGVVISTVDGGENWTVHTTHEDEPSLYDISFFDPLTGWAVGDEGIIVKTTDGGITWTSQRSNTNNNLLKLQLTRSGSGGVLFSVGDGGTIICSSISPLQIRTWTGVFDSLWFSGGNWNPIGVPEKLDSIVIPSTSRPPVIAQKVQQINISAMRIAAGAKLTIGPDLALLSVKTKMEVNGTLEIDSNATTEIQVGSNFLVSGSGKFIPGKSTVRFVGTGQLKGSFYNIVISEGANVNSTGNIDVKKTLMNLSNFSLRSLDTLLMRSADPYALQGNGIINTGTIKRAILAGSTAQYQFESPATYLRFLPGGTHPDTVMMTTYPNTLLTGFKDSLFVKRYYAISAIGGSNFNSVMSLRYDTSESKIPVDELAFFRDSSGVLINMGKTDFLDSDLTAINLDSVKRFSNWFLGYEDYIPKHPYEFLDSLFVNDSGLGSDTLLFGSSPGATDGLDFIFDEFELSPKPPAGTFDARWSIPSTQGSNINILDVFRGARKENIYTCPIQTSVAGSVVLRWNKAILPAGSFFLRDSATQGGQFNINMKLQSTYTIVNPAIRVVQIVHSIPKFVSFNRSWNMISLPITSASDGRKITIFPSATSFAYKYSGGYLAEDTLRNGRGYWLKFPSAQTVAIDGFTRLTDTINVVQGWNMIGSVTYPVAIGNIIQVPPNISAGSYYNYFSGYTLSDSIRPGKGYWVKASSPGKFILNSTGPAAKQPAVNESIDLLNTLNTISIQDNADNQQTLFFGNPSHSSFEKERFELPPTPPSGIFDARFISQHLVEITDGLKHTSTITIQSASYPVTIRWHVIQSQVRSIIFRDAATGTIVARGSGNDGNIQVFNPSVTNVTMEVKTEIQTPKEFSLQQNYPNPFNPTTNIAFELPVQSVVSLKLFNILGQEIASLADNNLYAGGNHIITLDASHLASGMYFYQLIAQGNDARTFRQVRKMLLLK